MLFVLSLLLIYPRQIFFTAEQIEWSAANVVWGFTIWQYAVLVVMGVFALVVPDIPYDVSIQLKRQKFITSKVIDRVRTTSGRLNFRLVSDDDAFFLFRRSYSSVSHTVEIVFFCAISELLL